MRTQHCIFLLVFCSVLLTTASWGQSLPESIVKVYSGVKKSKKTPYAGSGVALCSDSGTFVLTSEHVLIPSEKSAEHTVQTKNGQRFEAKLVAMEWGLGLALLEVKSKNPLASCVSLEEVSSSLVSKEEDIVFYGYPYKLTKVVADQARVLLPNSPRSQLPLLPSMIEAVGGHAEYGMSGGVAYSPGQSKIVGIISHQILVDRRSLPETVQNLDDESEINTDHILLIPSAVALNWVKSQMLGTNDGAIFLRSLGKSTNTQIKFSGLTFEVSKDTQQSSIGGDGAGIGGGGDGAGIGGGGDGVGIGGGGDGAGIDGEPNIFPKDKNSLKILVSIDRNRGDEFPQSSKTPSFRGGFFKDFKQQVIEKKNVSIVGYVELHEGKFVHHSITTLEDFFTALNSKDVFVLVERTDHHTSDSEAFSQIKEALNELTKCLSCLPNKSLIQDVSTLVELFEFGYGHALMTEAIDQLLKREEEWSMLFDYAFDETVRLYQDLENLKDLK